jgi:hypothetical protein
MVVGHVVVVFGQEQGTHENSTLVFQDEEGNILFQAGPHPVEAGKQWTFGPVHVDANLLAEGEYGEAGTPKAAGQHAAAAAGVGQRKPGQTQRPGQHR